MNTEKWDDKKSSAENTEMGKKRWLFWTYAHKYVNKKRKGRNRRNVNFTSCDFPQKVLKYELGGFFPSKKKNRFRPTHSDSACCGTFPLHSTLLLAPLQRVRFKAPTCMWKVEACFCSSQRERWGRPAPARSRSFYINLRTSEKIHFRTERP